MSVKRIVCNVATDDVAGLQEFYQALFGLDTVMDLGWIATLASGRQAEVQISLASQGGSGTVVPDMSIEVDDVEATYAKARSLGCAIDYKITDEPWGVRRFYVRDPAGKLINVLAHQPDGE